MSEEWRGWTEEDFDRISTFLRESESSPTQTRVIGALISIALTELEVIDDNDIISTCAEALCVLATPYAEESGFDPNWKVDLT